MKLRRPWTPADDAALAECLARGMSRATIAIRLKRSQIGIRSRIRMLSLATTLPERGDAAQPVAFNEEDPGKRAAT